MGSLHDSIDGNLVPQAQLDDVAAYHVFRQDLALFTIPPHQRMRRVDNRQGIERFLRAVFRRDTDDGVEYHHAAEHCVPPVPHNQYHNNCGGKDRVEQGENIRSRY